MVCWALNISLCLLLLRQFQTVFSTMKVIHGKINDDKSGIYTAEQCNTYVLITIILHNME